MVKKGNKRLMFTLSKQDQSKLEFLSKEWNISKTKVLKRLLEIAFESFQD